MKKENNENLKELLAAFFDAEEASKAAEDIIAGQHILDSNPAPRPSPALLADIKQRMAAAAESNVRQGTHRFLWQFAAAAAAVVIVAWAGITLLMQKPGETWQYAQASESFWQDTLTSLENGIDSQIAQFELTESDAPLVTLEANGNHDTAAITDMTDELNEIKETFWEG